MDAKGKIKESKAVYSSLRSEILLIEEMQRNVFLYMNSIFAVLYTLGVQFGHIFFLMTFIVLIPFQSKINYYSWAIRKMSIYIRVFFEETSDNIHWESFQTYPAFVRTAKYRANSIWGFFIRFSTALLGSLASISFIVMQINNFDASTGLSEAIIGGILILFAVVLAVLVWMITKGSSKEMDIELFDIIDHYKRDLESGHTPKEFRVK